MVNKTIFLRELKNVLHDPSQAEAVWKLFETMERMEAEARKQKQQLGIEMARKNGISLGRPKIEEPEDFNSIMEAWERKEMKAEEAARLCGMGVSTFYRRVRNKSRQEYNYEERSCK